MDIRETIIVGIISSIIASIVFYLWMILIKPRFIISDKICIKKTQDSEADYMVKVANTTRSFITNVSYSLLYCVEGEDGLKDICTIDPYKPPITYKIDEEKFPLNENSFFMFTFQAYHSFSNAMKIEKRVFRKSDVQQGIFETGKSTKILSHR